MVVWGSGWIVGIAQRTSLLEINDARQDERIKAGAQADEKQTVALARVENKVDRVIELLIKTGDKNG